MSADAVRAAAEALHASWKVGADSFSQDMAGHAAQRDAATAVAAAEPIVRADERVRLVRALIEQVCALCQHGDTFQHLECKVYADAAARIARGQP